MKPVVKWAGGKTQLLPIITPLLPNKIKKYYEPFGGGGALLWHVLFKRAYLNDSNEYLIHLYNIIKEKPELLIRELKKYEQDENSISKEYFLKVRSEYNNHIKRKRKNVKIAAMFIYLNKTSFNGLYRVNSQGVYNVPFNNRKTHSIFSKENILEMSKYLKNIEILSGDFSNACKYARKGDFVFFDPPYAPLNETSFTKYTKNGFNENDNERLAKLFKKLSNRGINCMLTNHDTKLIRSLYHGYNFSKVKKIEKELELLQELIDSEDIKTDFERILISNKEILKHIPLLIAKRSDKKIDILDGNKSLEFDFNKMSNNIEEYSEFMKKTNIFNLLGNGHIRNLKDYIIGVEVGLDTNARKNRTGQVMESIVEQHLKDAGYREGVTFFKEITTKDLTNKFNLNLYPISNSGKHNKRFDFAVIENGHIFGIEVNFYNSSGSKLNETSRSYKNIFENSKDIKNFSFMWITDGNGWKQAHAGLRETYEVSNNIYNLNDLENGLFKEIFKK